MLEISLEDCMKLLLTAILALFSTNAARADGFLVFTDISWSNTSPLATQEINPNPGWDSPYADPRLRWLSNYNSGDPSAPGFVVPPNGTEVEFDTTVNVLWTLSSAAMYVACDDTCRGIVNGTEVFGYASLIGNTFSHCSDSSPSCVTGKEVLGLNIVPYLHTGVNTIGIMAKQVNGFSFGVAGAIAGTYTAEPGTFLFVSLALMVIGLMVRNRTQSC